ncbi:hypothetical protein AAMO2058_000975500 [Amorphochlora amoebiformis]
MTRWRYIRHARILVVLWSILLVFQFMPRRKMRKGEGNRPIRRVGWQGGFQRDSAGCIIRWMEEDLGKRNATRQYNLTEPSTYSANGKKFAVLKSGRNLLDWKTYHVESFNKLREMVERYGHEIDGGLWIHPQDYWQLSEEALIRLIHLGIDTAYRTLGKRPNRLSVFSNNGLPGYLPQIFRAAKLEKIRFFSNTSLNRTHALSPDIWRGLDGTTIPISFHSLEDPDSIRDTWDSETLEKSLESLRIRDESGGTREWWGDITNWRGGLERDGEEVQTDLNLEIKREEVESLLKTTEFLMTWAILRKDSRRDLSEQESDIFPGKSLHDSPAYMLHLWDRYLTTIALSPNESNRMLVLEAYRQISTDLREARSRLLDALQIVLSGNAEDEGRATIAEDNPWFAAAHRDDTESSDMIPTHKQSETDPETLRMMHPTSKMRREREKRKKESLRKHREEALRNLRGMETTEAALTEAGEIECPNLVVLNPTGFERSEVIELPENPNSGLINPRHADLEVRLAPFRTRVRAFARKGKRGCILANGHIAAIFHPNGTLETIYHRSTHQLLNPRSHPSHLWAVSKGSSGIPGESRGEVREGSRGISQIGEMEIIERGPIRGSVRFRYSVDACGGIITIVARVGVESKGVDFEVEFKEGAQNLRSHIDFPTSIQANRRPVLNLESPFISGCVPSHNNMGLNPPSLPSRPAHWASFCDRDIGIGVVIPVRRLFSSPAPGVIRLHLASGNGNHNESKVLRMKYSLVVLPGIEFLSELDKRVNALKSPLLLLPTDAKPPSSVIAYPTCRILSTDHPSVIIDSLTLPNPYIPPPSNYAGDIAAIVRLRDVSGKNRVTTNIVVGEGLMYPNRAVKTGLDGSPNFREPDRELNIDKVADGASTEVALRAYEVSSIRFESTRGWAGVGFLGQKEEIAIASDGSLGELDSELEGLEWDGEDGEEYFSDTTAPDDEDLKMLNNAKVIEKEDNPFAANVSTWRIDKEDIQDALHEQEFKMS